MMSSPDAEEFWTRAQRIEAEKHAARHAAVYENFLAQFPGAPCELLTHGEENPTRLRLRFRTLALEVCDRPGPIEAYGVRWYFSDGTWSRGLSMTADCGDLFRLCADWETEIARTGAPSTRPRKTRHKVSFSPVSEVLVGRLKPTGKGIRRWYAMALAFLGLPAPDVKEMP
jgi:hypothetical protein